MYWFQQALGQGPQFLVQYFDGKVYQRGNMSDRFSGQQSGSELNLTSLELMDSALYLCASSQGENPLHFGGGTRLLVLGKWGALGS